MSVERPKRPKRTTDRRAGGRKGRGHRSQGTPNPLTKHRCELCGQRRKDSWGKVPRLQYGVTPGRHAHLSCVLAREEGQDE